MSQSGIKSPSYMFNKKSSENLFDKVVVRARQQDLYNRPQSQLEPSNQQSMEHPELGNLSQRFKGESPLRYEGAFGEKNSMPSMHSSKNIKIINSTKAIQQSKDVIKRWSVK
jgi:hypothetical protein